ENTTIYINSQEIDPNQEMMEINVRKCCFYPDRVGINYITVSGFEVAQAACHWAPPTGDQVGMIGAHWSKGWIIENNIIHDAKCSGISIGKEKSTGEELSHKRSNKSGHQCLMECEFEAIHKGWSKEFIGSHIIRNNEIYDCGQNAIVGHMGGAFSEIYGNHIYGIGIKHEFMGWEVAGIKLHAAIDTQIRGNCIHDCTLGFWMDWEAQGTRISRNILFNNQRDGFIEVTHGPMVFDNNIFADDYALDNHAQGTAFINNIFNGFQSKHKILDRSTPYYIPHSTRTKGYAFVHSGDDRYYNNIFVKKDAKGDEYSFYGTEGYDPHTASMEEYLEELVIDKNGDHVQFFKVEQPAYVNQNVYYNGAKGFKKEKENYESDNDCNIKITTESDGIYLEMDVEEGALLEAKVHNTKSLGKVRIVDVAYDTPTGEYLVIDRDYNGNIRDEKTPVGPFANIKIGKNKFKVWPN
ncbi:MAG: right-handed parallel beta-helix repeat-containing protein, partial [Eubacteriales bacterium]